MFRKILLPAVIVLPFLLYLAVGMKSRLVSPRVGIYTRNESGTRVVEQIAPHSPGEWSGIQPGDRIVAIDGQNVQGPNWIAAQMNIAAGRRATFDADRAGQRMSFTFTPDRNSWSDLSSYDQVQFVVTGLGSLIMLGCAFALAFSRPNSGAALAGALLLASLTTINATSPTGFAAAWRTLPWFVGVIMWIPILAEGISPALVFTFCATFPGRFIRSQRVWAMIWMPALAVLFLFVRFMYFNLYDPVHAPGKLTPPLIGVIIGIGMLYVAIGVVMMAVSYRHLDAIKRRAVRPLVFGTIAAMAAPPLAMILNSVPIPAVRWIAESLAFGTFVHIIIYWVFPLSFVHSVLRHRGERSPVA